MFSDLLFKIALSAAIPLGWNVPSEDEFVVKMGPEDGDNVRSITLAHDYLKFNGRNWYCTNMQLKDTPWSYANVIDVRTSIQIPIRMAQDMLENVLNKDRKYLKKDHLVRSDGLEAYSDPVGLSYRYSTDDGIKMIAVYRCFQSRCRVDGRAGMVQR